MPRQHQSSTIKSFFPKEEPHKNRTRRSLANIRREIELKVTVSEDELNHLRKENQRLLMENDILKKKC